MTRQKVPHIILILLLLLTLLLVAACGGGQSTSAGSPTPTPVSKQSALLQALRPYAPAFTNQLAQGLHLTPTQLTQQVQAGKTLTEIASTQGISATQLQTLITHALSKSLEPAVQAGDITQKQLDKIEQRLLQNPDQLDALLMK